MPSFYSFNFPEFIIFRFSPLSHSFFHYIYYSKFDSVFCGHDIQIYDEKKEKEKSERERRHTGKRNPRERNPLQLRVNLEMISAIRRPIFATGSANRRPFPRESRAAVGWASGGRRVGVGAAAGLGSGLLTLFE